MNAERILPELMRLEQLLLDPAFRRNPSAVVALLTEDFCEFGSSGCVYDKAAILALLASETSEHCIQASDFVVVILGQHAALLTYRSTARRDRTTQLLVGRA